MKVCADGSLHLLLYLASSEFREVQSAATRALANLTQSIDCEPALRAPRAPSSLLAAGRASEGEGTNTSERAAFVKPRPEGPPCCC